MSEARALPPRYRLGRPIGSGGMGDVFEATDTITGARVAVKFLRAEQLTDPQTRARFEREARLLAQLRSPHIVRLIDHDAAAETPYLVMELLEGGTLAARLAEAGALPVNEAVEIAAAVADALDEAHRIGIVHRDLKPSNISFDRGRVVLTDFGIAMQPNLQDGVSTATGTVLGTLYYLAPEQGCFEEADARTDLYALGLVLFEMLTGRLPFEGHGVQQLVARNTDTAPRVSKFRVVPEAIDQVVARCLERERKNRPAHAKWVASALRAELQQAPRIVANRRLLLPFVLATLTFAGLALVYAPRKTESQRAHATPATTHSRAAGPAMQATTPPPAAPPTVAHVERVLLQYRVYSSGVDGERGPRNLSLGEDGIGEPADPTRVFADGERIHLAFDSSVAGYLYVFNAGSDGASFVRLLPNDDAASAVAVRETRFVGPIDIVPPAGVDRLVVVLSTKPVAAFERDAPESRAAAELARGRYGRLVEQERSGTNRDLTALFFEAPAAERLRADIALHHVSTDTPPAPVP